MQYCLFANDDKSVQTPIFNGLQGNRRRCESAINFSGIRINTPESAAVVRTGYGSAQLAPHLFADKIILLKPSMAYRTGRAGTFFESCSFHGS